MKYWLCLLFCLAAFPAIGFASLENDVDYFTLSLEELADIEVSVAAKKPQRLFESPAAVTILTSEDIHRSGLTSIPELLRLVPGLEVARVSSSSWAISARGFNSLYANKLLVLLDGRTLYNPFFSGTFWQVQDTPLADIDRIEVVRGPGASLWGSNAVNGIINIVTKSADQTQGTLVDLSSGRPDNLITTARYGGRLGRVGHYRIYGKYFDREASPGNDIADDWDQGRGGFRMDWQPTGANRFSLQGEYFAGELGRASTAIADAPPFNPVQNRGELEDEGGHLLGKWRRSLAGEGELSLQVYLDHIRTTGVYLLENDILDVEFQHRRNLSTSQELVWGAGFRVNRNRFSTSEIDMAVADEQRTDQLFSLFLQDDITLAANLWHLVLGSKFEHNDYTGFEIQPSLRLAWTPTSRHTLWAAVSRAVRVPSRLDTEILIGPITVPLPPPVPPQQLFIFGSEDLDAEELWAFELGYRQRLGEKLLLDSALFYNVYDRLIVGEPSFANGGFALAYANGASGKTWGGEISLTWSPLELWQLTTSYSHLRMNLEDSAGGSEFADTATLGGTSPRHQAKLISHLNLPYGIEFDTMLFYVDDLEQPRVPGYLRLDTRLGCRLGQSLEASLALQNLLDDRHIEFVDTTQSTDTGEIGRGFVASLTWRY